MEEESLPERKNKGENRGELGDCGWKFQEEHLKVINLLSAAEGSKVKELGDQEVIGFH